MKAVAPSSSVTFTDLREASYASVRTYNRFLDSYPDITPLSGDLKDFQRPWTADAVLGNVPKGSRILEIGAGSCVLAEFLRRAGYDVWVVDPFDGSGGGPDNYEELVRRFPHLKFVRSEFHLADVLKPGYFDGCYSCSVIEHIPASCFKDTVTKSHDILVAGGFSIHAIDWTLEGTGTDFLHKDFIRHCGFNLDWPEIASAAMCDADTFILSPQGHYKWRKFLRRTYDEWPYRKITSFNFVAKK